MRYRALVLFVVVVLAAVSPVAKCLGGCLKDARETLTEILDKGHNKIGNQFETLRDLNQYLSDFPYEVTDELKKLGPNDHVIDVGAGEAIAAEQLVSATPTSLAHQGVSPYIIEHLSPVIKRNPSQRPRVTAITFQINRRDVPTHGGKLRVLSGRLFGDIPNTEIGSAKLILEDMGVIAYAPDVDRMIAKDLELLEPNGSIYVIAGVENITRFDNRGSFGFESTVQKKDGTKVSLVDWMKSSPGLEVTELSNNKVPIRDLTVRIRRKADARVQIPKLERISEMSDNTPPVRHYREIDGFLSAEVPIP